MAPKVHVHLVGVIAESNFHRFHLVLSQLQSLDDGVELQVQALTQFDFEQVVEQPKVAALASKNVQQHLVYNMPLVWINRKEYVASEKQLLDFCCQRCNMSTAEFLSKIAFEPLSLRQMRQWWSQMAFRKDASDPALLRGSGVTATGGDEAVQQDQQEEATAAQTVTSGDPNAAKYRSQEAVERSFHAKAVAMAQATLHHFRRQSGSLFAFLVFQVDQKVLPRIEIELFASICPRTCANFLAFCEKQVADAQDPNHKWGYQGNIVHQVVHDAWIQTGDVLHHETNGQVSGKNAIVSLYGKAFADECFSVSHDRPGILSMANMGPHTNGSQFFITLAPLPWLDKRKVAFGRVISGMSALRTVGSVPTELNQPLTECKIVQCGRIPID